MRISGLFVSGRTAGYIKELYRRSEADRRIRMLGVKRARMFAVITGIFLVAAIPVSVIDNRAGKIPVTRLSRNEYGEGERTVTLRAITDGEYVDDISVKVEERTFSEAELAKFSEKLDSRLWKEILGKNPDPENIMYDLELPDHIDGFPFTIRWRSDKPLILTGSGVINREKMSEESGSGQSTEVLLTATLSCQGHTEEKQAFVLIRPFPADVGRNLKRDVEESVKLCDKESSIGPDMILPSEISGKKIIFYEKAVNKGWVILLMGTAAAIFYVKQSDDRIRKEATKRKKQIDADHARILNQYALYHTAGMNPRAIWGKIVNGYEQLLKESEKNRRYAYDEMVITKMMMDDGVGELAAYDDLAVRLSSLRYRSFISLVKQAVKNGGENLSDLLREETEKAQKEHLNTVREEAAKSQTKMLLPMFMMLLVVIVIVCIPAFLGLEV